MADVKLFETEVSIPAAPGHRDLIRYIRKAIAFRLGEGTVPVRFAMTRMDDQHYRCEFATIEGLGPVDRDRPPSIFQFVPRKAERTEAFNAVFLVPTGIGAKIGGHAGDATRRATR